MNKEELEMLEDKVNKWLYENWNEGESCEYEIEFAIQLLFHEEDGYWFNIQRTYYSFGGDRDDYGYQEVDDLDFTYYLTSTGIIEPTFESIIKNLQEHEEYYKDNALWKQRKLYEINQKLSKDFAEYGKWEVCFNRTNWEMPNIWLRNTFEKDNKLFEYSIYFEDELIGVIDDYPKLLEKLLEMAKNGELDYDRQKAQEVEIDSLGRKLFKNGGRNYGTR